ncbi:MAG: polysaccharide deacetylase family protein [Spirochaetes bacterium]|nr:polysaccharide deacetylase family protein [Spirochaetota bacterium]
MPSTLLIGYDVERVSGRVPGEKWVGQPVPENATAVFLERIAEVHGELRVPATIFMLGRNIEKNLRALEKCVTTGMFEIAQHTQDHYPLKTIIEEDGSRVYLRGLDFDAIEEQIAKPMELLKKYLGIDCRGVTAPYTYYRGLSDRPDILDIIDRCGLSYVRSYGRNSRDYFPLSWDVQPFRYERQGFPAILEIPIQGWIDAQWRHDNGWEKTEEYFNFLTGQVDRIKDENICWSHVQHDWTSILHDKQLHWTEKFIAYASKSLTTKTHCDYYRSVMPASAHDAEVT